MQWEYLVKTRKEMLETFETLQDALDDVGSRGWELMGIDKGEFVFKRPKKGT